MEDILNYFTITPGFNSILFFLGFTLLYALYVLWGNKIQLRNALLLGFSLIFYIALSGNYIFLLILISLSDYMIGNKMLKVKDQDKIKWRNLALCIDLGILGYFKYLWFFADTGNVLFDFNFHKPEQWLVPVGISFYIFKSLSYILDIFHEKIETPAPGFSNYLLYLSFFPNIMAGPIVPARDFLPQLISSKLPSQRDNSLALFMILCGMIKKYGMADALGLDMVDRVFTHPHLFAGVEHLMAAYGYTLQLYLDFSGYSDMMIGGSMLLGIHIHMNFNAPFRAGNISEFWRRWHISLSLWFQEFVFIPLNYTWRRLGIKAVVYAVLITFLLSGLWHGAAWTYVLWGLLHGLAIVWDTLSKQWRMSAQKWFGSKFWNILSIFLTFHFIVFTIVLFRSDSMELALEMFKGIFTNFNIHLFGDWLYAYQKPFIILMSGLILHYLPDKWTENIRNVFVDLPWSVQSIILAFIIFILFQGISAESVPFQYLQY